MSTYVIISKEDTDYQILEKIFTKHPVLKNGFTLRWLLRSPSLSWDERKSLKEIFGGNYSKVLTPGFDFEYQNRKWMVEVIDVNKGFHQF